MKKQAPKSVTIEAGWESPATRVTREFSADDARPDHVMLALGSGAPVRYSLPDARALADALVHMANLKRMEYTTRRRIES